MATEFDDCCLLVIDPKMPVHQYAYVVIEYKNELYFRQYIETNNKRIMHALNTAYPDIELVNEFDVKGCVVQQKQKGKPTKHYYQLNSTDKKQQFIVAGYHKKRTT